jgi:para-aminobenzoate synthetase component 1
LRPVYTPVSYADTWALARHFAGWPHRLCLDGTAPYLERPHYSYLTADPVRWLAWRVGDPGDPFAILADWLTEFPATPFRAKLPPFQGGIAGLFGYGLSRHLEHLPAPRGTDLLGPDVAVGLYDWVLALDHQQRSAYLISTGIPDLGRAGQRRAVQRTRQVLAALAASPPPEPQLLGPVVEPDVGFPLPGWPGVRSNFTPVGFQAAVARAVEYIHAGDCFQVNLAQRLLAPLSEPPGVLFARLRERNPAPFAAYFDLGEQVLLSASPERFVAVRAGQVETRPIKGTRPRGPTPAEDAALLAELQASGKDRAENVMIVDLLRNDLGRVCAYGSVQVPVVCQAETYRFVHHLVSEVRGQLRPGLTALDLLRASLPGGSVTGAPKVRAMQIIAELEPSARGAYCGSLGYIGLDGTADTNILIRTFTATPGWVQFPVGGGIVAESNPTTEYAETLHKAAGLLASLRA